MLTKVPLARIVLGQPPQHVRTLVGAPRFARRDQPEMFQSEKINLSKYLNVPEKMLTMKGLATLTFHDFKFFISTQENVSPPPNAIFFSNKDNSLLLP